MTTGAGAGPGSITRDGCAVDLYLLLQPRGEAEMIHAAVTPGASILELGCGTGRITRGLLDLGHSVLGVDWSDEMLVHMPAEARAMQADIGTLRLEERFDVVTLTNNVATSADDAQNLAFLRTARHHLAPGGLVVMERLHPHWMNPAVRAQASVPQRYGAITQSFDDLRVDGEIVHLTVRYAHDDGRAWTQSADMRVHTDERLSALLVEAGLRQVRWLDERREWALAEAG